MVTAVALLVHSYRRAKYKFLQYLPVSWIIFMFLVKAAFFRRMYLNVDLLFSVLPFSYLNVNFRSVFSFVLFIAVKTDSKLTLHHMGKTFYYKLSPPKKSLCSRAQLSLFKRCRMYNFLTTKHQENTWQMNFVIYQRIVCHQIVTQITNVWFSCLPAKKIGKLWSIYVVWDWQLTCISFINGCLLVFSNLW